MADKDKEGLWQDWGPGGESRSLVPAEPASTDPDTLPAPDALVAEMRGDLPSGDAELDPELKKTWEREGGYEQNLARAQAAATDILARSPDLEAKFERLPESIQSKAFDHLRLGVAKGRGIAAIAAFESRLTDQELAIYTNWVAGLTLEERRAIVGYLNGGRE